MMTVASSLSAWLLLYSLVREEACHHGQEDVQPLRAAVREGLLAGEDGLLADRRAGQPKGREGNPYTR
jgi:hypothetical protein